MLSCKELTELVTEYLEGSMPLGDRLRFKMHLAMCPPCKRYLRQVELTVDALGRIEPPELPDDVQTDLMDAFRGWKDQTAR